jgi:hypothetical protein
MGKENIGNTDSEKSAGGSKLGKGQRQTLSICPHLVLVGSVTAGAGPSFTLIFFLFILLVFLFL